MRPFLKDKAANVAMIGAAVAILVTIVISILIVYNIAGSMDLSGIDDNFGGAKDSPAHNATNNTLAQAETFYTLAPLIVVVLVAVVILGYVTKIGQ